jgi:hypothetical protein
VTEGPVTIAVAEKIEGAGLVWLLGLFGPWGEVSGGYNMTSSFSF